MSRCFSKNKNSPVLISTSNGLHVKIYHSGNIGSERTPGKTPDFWTSPRNPIDLTGFQEFCGEWIIVLSYFNFRHILDLRDLTKDSGYLTGLEIWGLELTDCVCPSSTVSRDIVERAMNAIGQLFGNDMNVPELTKNKNQDRRRFQNLEEGGQYSPLI